MPIQPFNILINPPWMLIGWMSILYLLAFLFCLRILIWLNTHTLERKQKQLKKKLSNCSLELQESQEALELKSKTINAQSDQLEKALAQLVRAGKMSYLGQLTAGIAHEINDPINFIHANIDTLSENIQDIMKVLAPLQELQADNHPEKLSEILKLKQVYQFDLAIQELEQLLLGIREGSVRTTQIVQGLRYYSRADEDLFTKTDIHKNLDISLTLLQHRFKGRVKIVKEYNAKALLEASPNQLTQVFMNVLSNALDAIEGKGTIIVRTQDIEQDKINISFQDTGVGITEDTQKRIYEPYFTTKPHGEGVGLGLAIVRSIVEKHQGRIHIKSQREEGTQFDIILPYRQT